MKKGVLLVAARSLLGEGLRAAIGRSPVFQVVGMASDRAEAIRLALATRPALVVLDLSGSDRDQMELIRRIRRQVPAIPILAVSPDTEPGRILAALEAGASGVVQRTSSIQQLTQCLEQVSAGGFCVDERTVRDLARAARRSSGAERKPPAAPDGGLSERESEVLRGMAEGKTTKAIARELQISAKTVQNHRSRLMKRLRLQTASDIIRYAAKVGLIEIEDWMEGH